MYNIPIEWEMSTEFLKTWSKSKKEEHRTGGQIKKMYDGTSKWKFVVITLSVNDSDIPSRKKSLLTGLKIFCLCVRRNIHTQTPTYEIHR